MGNAFFQLIQAAASEFLRNVDGKSMGHPLHTAEHHKDQPLHGSQGRQGGKPQILSHDYGIHKSIKLLEKIPKHQRKGKM